MSKAYKIEVMWTSRRFGYLQPSAYVRRATSFVDREFQLNYTKKTLWMFFTASLFAYGPVLYFLNENYSLLRDLMYSAAPEIVSHLEREQSILNASVILIFFAQIAFVLVYSRKMTGKIVGPVKKLRNFFRLLSRGEYSSPNLRVRDDDEFQDLISSFNYFYSGLQEQTHRDLMRLKEARKLSEHPIMNDSLDQMINEKAYQLNVPDQLSSPVLKPLTSLKSDEADGPRHAS